MKETTKTLSNRRPRRAPLYAVKSNSIDQSSLNSNQKTLMINQMDQEAKIKIYSELYKDLTCFLDNATDNWYYKYRLLNF